jgi:hypothetical protein
MHRPSWKTATSQFVLSLIAFAGIQAASGQTSASSFSKADSGWVRLFNGTDLNGFYSRLYAAPVVHPVDTSAFAILYPGTDTACIRAKNTAKRGELGTDRTDFSHYRTRMEYRFDVAQTNANAGLLYGVDETAIRMQNNWPRGFEFQMQQSEPGAVYSIQQVTADTKVTSGRYNPAGSSVKVCEYGCNARSYKGTVDVPSAVGTMPKWMRIELIQRGADSAIHIVNDTVVMKIWNIRIFNDSTKTTGGTNTSGGATLSNFTPGGPYPSGALAVEGEGALINHRRWEVMEFPAGTPMNEHFLHRLFLDAPVRPVKPITGVPIQVTYRSIGTIPKIKIEYRIGTGAWQSAADSVANTGTYSMTGLTSASDSVRFRISSLGYVWGDSTGNPNTTGVRPAPKISYAGRLVVRDGKVVVPGAQNLDRIDIRSASGQRVRSIRGGRLEQAETVTWDLRDRQGDKVPPGLYFLKLSGPAGIQTVRVSVF